MCKVIIKKEDGTTGDVSVGPDGYVYLMDGETVLENPNNVKIHYPTESNELIGLAKATIVMGLIIVGLLVVAVLSKA